MHHLQTGAILTPSTAFFTLTHSLLFVQTPRIFSTDTFKLQYSTKASSAFLDQAYSSATSGFVPNSLGADANFGKCIQCAAIDRARLKANPIVPRSDFCQNCFTQYCYDPESKTTPGAVVGRKLKYVDPDTVTTTAPPSGSTSGATSVRAKQMAHVAQLVLAGWVFYYIL